jgi:TrmH family RNA methyltransferase
VRRISSRSNPLVARFRAAARGRDPDSLLLDGEHLIEEALASGITLDAVALAETIADTRPELIERLERSGAEVVRVPSQVMAAMSPVKQPAGLVALGRASGASLEEATAGSPQLIVLMQGIQDAGNVGAIVRAADGCGATGLIACEGTADPFGWKALRGAMGSTFRVPIAVRQPAAAALAQLRRQGISIVATVPRDGTPLPRFTLTGPVAILLGGEGPGLPPDVIGQADQRLSIPMRAPVESFNVAITAALVLYEAAKQRNGHVALL